MKRSDHCEEVHVKALISKNNSTLENTVSCTDTVWKLNASGEGLLRCVKRILVHAGPGQTTPQILHQGVTKKAE